jgi:hypothetical protein
MILNRVVLKVYFEKGKPLMVGHGFMEKKDHICKEYAESCDTISDAFQRKSGARTYIKWPLKDQLRA